jgi:hypothetical protein
MDRGNRPEGIMNRRQDRFEYKSTDTLSVFLLGFVAVVGLSVVVFLA